MAKLRPYVEDGKHWILYNDGSIEREKIDPNLIKQYEELGMNEITKNKLLANMEQTLKQIQEQFHFFNTGHKLKLEG